MVRVHIYIYAFCLFKNSGHSRRSVSNLAWNNTISERQWRVCASCTSPCSSLPWPQTPYPNLDPPAKMTMTVPDELWRCRCCYRSVVFLYIQDFAIITHDDLRLLFRPSVPSQESAVRIIKSGRWKIVKFYTAFIQIFILNVPIWKKICYIYTVVIFKPIVLSYIELRNSYYGLIYLNSLKYIYKTLCNKWL